MINVILGQRRRPYNGGGGGRIGVVYKITRVLNMARGMWQQTHKEQPRFCHMQPAFP